MRTPEEIDKYYSVEELQKKFSKIKKFWSNIQLGTKFTLPGRYGPDNTNLIENALPKDLTGKSILDIGTRDGGWAFECERRNAKKITAIDNWQRRSDGYDDKLFKLCHEILNSKVKLIEMGLVEIDTLNKNFDIVLFLGVYYHMINPLLGLQKIFNICNELVIMEGAMLQTERSLAYALKKGELNADVKNVFLFSPSFIERFALSIGFKKVEFKEYVTEQGIKIQSDVEVVNSEQALQHNRGILYLWK